MDVTMDNPKQFNEPVKMTLDELFRRTFSNLLASLMDTLKIFEEHAPPEDSSNDPGS
jgi:hypothetical protein